MAGKKRKKKTKKPQPYEQVKMKWFSMPDPFGEAPPRFADISCVRLAQKQKPRSSKNFRVSQTGSSGMTRSTSSHFASITFLPHNLA